MDAALKLKIAISSGQVFSEHQIIKQLECSELLHRLIADIPNKPLALVWRLIGISEISFSYLLDYTKQLIATVYNQLATPYGFSLNGNKNMFLPCYNAMIVSALCRLNRGNDEEVKNALEWINAHQPMKRGEKVSHLGFNFEKFGGCFNQTPCYIGVAKAVFALQDYKTYTGNTTYESKLQQGIDYMLEHKLFKRISNNEPITKHITDLSFPETYHLNVVELIRFARKANLLHHEQVQDLIIFIKSKQTKELKWKTTFRYKAEGYIAFDKSKSGKNG